MIGTETRDEAFARLVPWYANGTLDDADRRRLETHLPGCADCRELLAHARLASEVGRRHSAGELEEDHVESPLLVRFQDHRESLEPDPRERIELHLRRCPVCRDAVSILEDLGATPERETPPVSEPAPPHRKAWWRTLAARFLGPVPALVYLFLLVLVLAWQLPRLASRGPSIAGAPVEALPPATRLTGEMTFRDDGSRPQAGSAVEVPLQGDPPFAIVELLADVEPGDTAAGHVLEIRDGESTVWSWRPDGGAFDRRGGLTLRLDGTRLQPGRDYVVRLRRELPGSPDGDVEVFRRSFRLVAAPTS